MFAAIYARKSTAQDDVDDDQKSVLRQIDNARAFAAAKGWTVSDAHVYADDAISGAEVRKLVNRQRLLDTTASERPPFQVLIMRDASRFSRRDGDEAFGELKRLTQQGIEVWFYQDNARFTFGTFSDNVVGFVRAEMNAEYRRQIARFTHEAMVRKLKAGHVVGGVVFGYDNVRVGGQSDGRGREGHTERRINEAEAAIVRRIFDLSASGWGYTRIAKTLNAERAPRSTPHRKRTGTPPSGWSPSTVFEVLHRPLYRGRVVWNKTRKKDATGHTAVKDRPRSEWFEFDRPELCIVPESTWRTVHARLHGIKSQLEAAGGGWPRTRRRRDIDSKYLLSGFARCAECGGTLSALSRNGGRSRFYAYGCLAHCKRGATVCTNARVVRVDRVEQAVVAKVTEDVLTPAFVRALIDEVWKAVLPDSVRDTARALRNDLLALDAKIFRLTDAVESGAALAPLVAKLHLRQAEREQLVASIASAEAMERVAVERDTVERKVMARLDRWRDLLLSDGRQLLREALDGPIQFEPCDEGYRFSGRLRMGTLFDGLIEGVHPLWRARQGSNLRPRA